MTTETMTAGYVLAAGEGKPVYWLDAVFQQKGATRDIGITEVDIRSGQEPPMHVHKYEDEWFYMLEGEVEFHCGGQSNIGRKDAFVFFPRLVPHTFTVKSDRARFIVMNTPGGFQRMFEMAPKNKEEAARAMAAVGIDIVGPNPGHV